jgi:competence protein ComEA
VPVVGEAVPPPVGPPEAPGSSVAPGPVDLNRATATELDALPGVGPATAQAIVSHRDANGPFASIDDLEQVRGIGPAKLDAIRPLVTV